uniref:Putative secreted protein n=1 Tax=Ixodes ricinus TaxID=34613 RepID=A0A6B0U6Z9_IXORI
MKFLPQVCFLCNVHTLVFLHSQCLYARTVAVTFSGTLHDAQVRCSYCLTVSLCTSCRGHRNLSSCTPGGLSLSEVYISAFK